MGASKLDAKGRATLAAVDTLRVKLLDLSGRNQLLSFKHSERSRKHVRVVNISLDVFFEQLNEGADFRFYSIPEPDDEPADEKNTQFRRALENAVATDAQYLDELKQLGDDPSERSLARTERELRDRVREKLNLPKRPIPTREIAARSMTARAIGVDPSYKLPVGQLNETSGQRNRRLQTLLYPDELERKLRGISEQARSSTEERGVNTLFAAIGFLEWYESGTATADAVYAPLLLFPVEIKRELIKGQYIYSITATGDEPSENLPLRERLKRDFDLALPKFDSEQHKPDDYFRKVSSILRTMRDWKTHRYLTIGHFEFTKLPMYEDLDRAHWEFDGTELSNHPVLSDLLGGINREDSILFADEYEVDKPPRIENLPHLITDADSSQLSAIIDAIDGKNLVIQGPPGTGKSQTITNLIAAALENGKRVLFVAEKMAALEVVKDRLDQAGVGEFCLELHSYKAKKRDVLDRLKERLELREKAPNRSGLSRAISEANALRGQLNKYAAILNQPFGSMGLTLHEILWKCHRLRIEGRLPDFLADVTLPAERVVKTTQIDAERETDLLARFERHRVALLSSHVKLENHPWRGVRNAGLTFVEEQDLIRAAATLRQHFKELRTLIADLNERVGSSIHTPQELVSFNSLVRTLPDAVQNIAFDTLSKLRTRPARHTLSSFLDRSKAIREAYQILGQTFFASDTALEDPAGLINLAEEIDTNHLATLDLNRLTELAADAEIKTREILSLTEFAGRMVRCIDNDLTVTPSACRTAIKAASLASQVSPDMVRRAAAADDRSATATKGESILNVDRLLELAASAQEQAQNAKDLATYAAQLIHCFSDDLPLTPSTAAVALKAAEHGAQILPKLLKPCSPKVLAEGGSASVSLCSHEAEKLRAIRNDLSKSLDLEILLDPRVLRDHSEALRHPHIIPLLWSSVRAARRLFRQLDREHRRLDAEQMAAELDALADFKDLVLHFEADPAHQALSLVEDITLDTNFEGYSAAALWADAARAIFTAHTITEELAIQKLLSGNSSLMDNLSALLRGRSAESLRHFLAGLDSGSNHVSFEVIIKVLEERVHEVRAIAEWGQRVREQLPGSDRTEFAAKLALLAADARFIRELSDLHRDPMEPPLQTFLANVSHDLKDATLDRCCDPYVQRADKLKILKERVKSAGLFPTIQLSRIRSLGLTAAHLQELLSACKTDEIAISLAGVPFAADEQSAAAFSETLQLASSLDESLLSGSVKRRLFECSGGDRIAELKSRLADAVQAYNQCASSAKAFTDLADLDPTDWTGFRRLDEVPFDRFIARLDLALFSEGTLDEWVLDLRLVNEIAALGLKPILDAYTTGRSELKDLKDAYSSIFYESLIRAAAKSFPEISRFSGALHNDVRRRFRELDKTILDLQRKHLRASLAQSRVDFGIGQGPKSEWTGLSLILNEIGRQKRLLPIRRLLERAGTSVQQMKPCFMMSPLSIAQYLSPKSITFDLVVMDEASQIRPEEALGAILRGGQLVVVGDSKQLPPTRFFEYTSDALEIDDEEQDDIGNEESILDMAASIFRPIRQLRWHYRSRHEDLIAFSNNRFYDDRLIVFPSPYPSHPERGLQLVTVKGAYRSGINPPEVDAVIRAAVEFILVHPNRSLGIVAMNVAQRDLLAEELDRISAEQPEIQQYRETWQKTLHPLFVKNLENVQGDERDVIFISLTYGPDEAGHFYQRFGPINSAAGHRRLNVLFTRAREKVVIFTSIDPYRIQVGSSSHPGVQVLRDYLLFAQDRLLDRSSPSRRQPDSDFEVTVSGALRELGFEVEYQVGVAGFFIDLAIRHPKRPGAYLLGIECDGAAYHSSRAARDRDRLRQEILEDLGWNIHRIWSVDWLKNAKKELARVAKVASSLLIAS